MVLVVDDHIRLELTAQQHAEGLFNVVNRNREHLSRFLPWVGKMRSVEDFEKYIHHCESLHAQGTETSFVVMHNNTIAGRIGIHYINTQNKSAAIGYWLAKELEGKGIITKCCRVIIQYGFQKLLLNRIEIKAAVENIRSQAIPEKLHFTKEGILREAELVNDKFLDLSLYSLLRSEYNIRIKS